MPNAIMENQTRNSGVVGVISFVGLCLVAGARHAVAVTIPPPLPSLRRLDDPAYAKARQELYELLKANGLLGDS
jgi:hypothetical protein